MPSPMHVRGLHVVRAIHRLLVTHRLGDTPQAVDMHELLVESAPLGVVYANVLAGMELLVALRERWALDVESTERLVQRGTLPKVMLQAILDDPGMAEVRRVIQDGHAWASEVPDIVIYPNEDNEP